MWACLASWASLRFLKQIHLLQVLKVDAFLWLFIEFHCDVKQTHSVSYYSFYNYRNFNIWSFQLFLRYLSSFLMNYLLSSANSMAAHHGKVWAVSKNDTVYTPTTSLRSTRACNSCLLFLFQRTCNIYLHFPEIAKWSPRRRMTSVTVHFRFFHIVTPRLREKEVGGNHSPSQ